MPKHEHLRADTEQVGEYLKEVQTAIAAYGETVLFLATESDAYKAIDASLTLAEKDVKVLTEKTKLAAALTSLKSTVARTRKAIGLGKADNEKPVLFDLAESIAANGKLGVGEATKRAERAKGLTEVLEAWEKLALRVLRCELWALAIGAAVGKGFEKPENELDSTEQDKLRETWIAVMTIREQLNQAGGAADVERLRTSGQIEAAFSFIAYLGEKCGVPEPPGRDSLDEASLKAGRAGISGDEHREPLTANFSTSEEFTVGVEKRQATAAEVKPGKTRRLIGAFGGDLLILFVGLVPAVVVALAAVYFGKNFGTFEDYLQLVGAGALGQALIKLLGDNFSLFVHDIRAAQGVEPAVFNLTPAPAAAPVATPG